MHLNRASIAIQTCPVSPKSFSELINRLSRGEITDRLGRAVLEEMFETGASPESIIMKRGLKTIADPAALEKAVAEVVAEHPLAAGQIAQGMTKPVDFLIGQVMKKTDGRAHPETVRSLIRKRLGSGPAG